MNAAFGMDQERSVAVCPAVHHMFVEVNFGLPHLALRPKHFYDELAPVGQLVDQPVDQPPHLLAELKVVKVP